MSGSRRVGLRRIAPGSIYGRLLVAGLILTGIALIAATWSINTVLDRFVRRSLDERLDGQIGLLLRGVHADGTVDRTMLQEIGPFTQYRRGWAWRIETPKGTYHSTETIALIGFREDGPRGREGHFREPPATLISGRTDDLYVRTLIKETPQGTIRVTAVAPHLVFERLRSAAITPVLATLAALSGFLLIGSLVQLHIGLQPLSRLRKSLADVRAGKADRVPEDQPDELQPVVDEVNGLLDENEAALFRARSHVANLAHSLKTPLATLTIRLSDLDRDPDGQLGALAAQIDGAIRHHLGRARAASPGAPGQPPVAVAPLVDELFEALGRIHADRNVTAHLTAEPGLTVKCDWQDLSEMLGNLLDNAWKWAKSQVEVTTSLNEGRVRIDIDDDGVGLGKAAMERALIPGRRLDEREDGHGFGLPIARELAELHGGSLELGTSPLGGLRATLLLPR